MKRGGILAKSHWKQQHKLHNIIKSWNILQKQLFPGSSQSNEWPVSLFRGLMSCASFRIFCSHPIKPVFESSSHRFHSNNTIFALPLTSWIFSKPFVTSNLSKTQLLQCYYWESAQLHWSKLSSCRTTRKTNAIHRLSWKILIPAMTLSDYNIAPKPLILTSTFERPGNCM